MKGTDMRDPAAIGRSTVSLGRSYEHYFGPRKDHAMTLRARIDALMSEFKPEDIVDMLAGAVSDRAVRAIHVGDYDSATQLDAMADDLFSQSDRLANAVSSQEDRSYYDC